jgi:hypothetical protein
MIMNHESSLHDMSALFAAIQCVLCAHGQVVEQVLQDQVGFVLASGAER